MITVMNPTLSGASRDDLIPRATRYEPSRSDACLTWRESGPVQEPETADLDTSSDPEAQRLFALLLDISQTGASIALDRIPRPKDGVWLRIVEDCPDDWTPAEVVGVTTTTLGPHLVRLAFRNPCPVETLISAICG